MARYRTKSDATRIIKDSASIARQLHWKNSLLLGLISFFVLYFVIPWVLPEPIAQTQGLQPIFDRIANRGQWIFEKLGIAVLVIFWFFALLNFWKEKR
jgi:hypothetical protein